MIERFCVDALARVRLRVCKFVQLRALVTLVCAFVCFCGCVCLRVCAPALAC